MKYRTKLYFSLVGVASISIILGFIIFSTETEKLIFSTLQSRSISIAASTAAQLDTDLVEKSILATSENDPNYIALQNILRKVLAVNHRNDIYVSEIYTLYVDPKNPQRLYFGVETDSKPEQPGSLYEEADTANILKNKFQAFANDHLVSDQWGLWLSAFAPILDQNGKPLAILGVDINAKDIHVRLQQLIKYALWSLIAAIFLSLLLAYFLSKKVTHSLDHLCFVVKEIGAGNLTAKATLETKDEFGVLAEKINGMAQGLQERERLKMSFARYVSTHVLDKILQSETPLKLEGERRKVTILFSDIRQFTQLAESLPPESVVQLLNEYFEVMIEIIFSHFGTLDKFIGDGIMAEFGAPLDDPKQEEHAIQAAIVMQKELSKLSCDWEKKNRPKIQMGIGIHTGEAIVGNIGSEKRVEYTAIGDTVNVASRLEEITKTLNIPLLLSETTYLEVKDQFPFKDLGPMTLPGRKEQVKVYTIELET